MYSALAGVCKGIIARAAFHVYFTILSRIKRKVQILMDWDYFRGFIIGAVVGFLLTAVIKVAGG